LSGSPVVGALSIAIITKNHGHDAAPRIPSASLVRVWCKYQGSEFIVRFGFFVLCLTVGAARPVQKMTKDRHGPRLAGLGIMLRERTIGETPGNARKITLAVRSPIPVTARPTERREANRIDQKAALLAFSSFPLKRRARTNAYDLTPLQHRSVRRVSDRAREPETLCYCVGDFVTPRHSLPYSKPGRRRYRARCR
jgi:hypothetical protein